MLSTVEQVPRLVVEIRQVASRLAEDRLAEWRRLDHAQWRLMLDDREPRQVVAEDGKRYSVVNSAVNDGEGWIHILLAVDDDGWSAFSPLRQDEIMRSDGSLLVSTDALLCQSLAFVLLAPILRARSRAAFEAC